MFDLVLLGPPGCGKGTQAKLLTKEYGLTYFGMGEELRARESEDEHIQILIDQGKFVPPEISESIAGEFLRGHEGERLLIDGYPRDLEQSEFFDRLMEDSGRDFRVIFLELSEDVARERIASRGEGRPDDTEEIEDERFRFYYGETMEVVDKYREAGKLIQIYASRSVEEIFADLRKQLH